MDHRALRSFEFSRKVFAYKVVWGTPELTVNVITECGFVWVSVYALLKLDFSP